MDLIRSCIVSESENMTAHARFITKIVYFVRPAVRNKTQAKKQKRHKISTQRRKQLTVLFFSTNNFFPPPHLLFTLSIIHSPQPPSAVWLVLTSSADKSANCFAFNVCKLYLSSEGVCMQLCWNKGLWRPEATETFTVLMSVDFGGQDSRLLV